MFRKKQTLEARRKIAVKARARNRSGAANPMYGVPSPTKNVPRTPEDIEKIRAAKLAYWEKWRAAHGREKKSKLADVRKGFARHHHTEEARKKISEGLRGRKMSAEWCAKLADRNRGRPSGMLKKKHKREALAVMSEKKRAYWDALTPEQRKARNAHMRAPKSEETKQRLCDSLMSSGNFAKTMAGQRAYWERWRAARELFH